MIKPRRRLIIVLGSVALGTCLAGMIIKQRFGTLKQDNVNQLIFNFFFAVCIVVGIGLLLARMNKKDNDKQ
jgi:hypothetical protein